MNIKGLRIAAVLMAAGAVSGFTGTTDANDYLKRETLVTESAVPLEEGAVDVEFGMTYSKANDGKRGMWSNNWSRSRRESFRMYEWTLEATMGVAPDTDVSLSTGWVDMYDRRMPPESELFGYDNISNHGRGMDDLKVSVKRRLLDDVGLSIAYIPGLTIPTGRHTNLGRGRFGPGQNYWSFDQRLAITQEIEDVTVNADIGYSLPFGRTRRTYKRDFGRYTGWNNYEGSEKSPREEGVLDFNVALAVDAGPLRPLAELNYAHRFISRGNGSNQLHATVGGIYNLNDNSRLKAGYQHPVAGRNAARTRRFLLSMAYAF